METANTDTSPEVHIINQEEDLLKSSAADDWNDDILMKIYRDTLKSHRTWTENAQNGQGDELKPKKPNHRRKNKKQQQSQQQAASTMDKAIPGEWESVPQTWDDEHESNTKSTSSHGHLYHQIDAEIVEAHEAMMIAYYHMGLTRGRYETLLEVKMKEAATAAAAGAAAAAAAAVSDTHTVVAPPEVKEEEEEDEEEEEEGGGGGP